MDEPEVSESHNSFKVVDVAVTNDFSAEIAAEEARFREHLEVYKSSQDKSIACQLFYEDMVHQFYSQDIAKATKVYATLCDSSGAGAFSEILNEIPQEYVANEDILLFQAKMAQKAWVDVSSVESAHQALLLTAQVWDRARAEQNLSLQEDLQYLAFSNISNLSLSFASEFTDLPKLASVVYQYAYATQCYLEKASYCDIKYSSELYTDFLLIGETTRAALLQSLATTLPPDASEIPVVALLPLSGESRKIGRAMLGAILLAQNVYSISPTFYNKNSAKLRIHFIDTQSSPQVVSQLKDVIVSHHPVAILGPIDIHEAQAASQVATDLQLPHLTFANVQKAPSYTLRRLSSTEAELDLLAQTIEDLGNHSVISVFPQTMYSESVTAQLNSRLMRAGRESLKSFVLDGSKSDWSTLAKEISRQSWDAIFLPTSPENASRIMSFLAQENIWCATPGNFLRSKGETRRFVTCLGTGIWNPLPDFNQIKFIENAIFPDSLLNYIPDPERQKFNLQFSELYKRSPALHEIHAFDATRFLQRAFYGKGSYSLQTLMSFEEYSGVSGNFKFVDNISTITPSMMQIQNGIPVVFAPTSSIQP